MISIPGELIEVGNLESGHGRGVVIAYQGRFVEVTGLTVAECQAIGKFMYEPVTVSVTPET